MLVERFDGRTVAYEYDDVGNRLKRVDSAEGTTTTETSRPRRRTGKKRRTPGTTETV
ncbi:hypothetical protein CKA32_005880 [Geitlerinema sp. FC II]|nr:hypothetical protein CKA32_005880 [Geitlerinema sp. FC II]